MNAPPMYWVKRPVRVAGLVWEGYQLLNEGVLWGNAAWGTSPAHQSRQRRTLPRPLSMWMRLLVDWRFVKSARPENRLPPLFVRVFPGPCVDRIEWIRSIQEACRARSIPLAKVDLALRDPAATLRLAYRLGKLAAARLGLASPELALALATARIAASPLLNRRRCEACFRVAYPGAARCRFHSRSKLVSEPGAVQASRTARRVLQGSEEIRRDIARRFGNLSREDVLAGALFPHPAQRLDEWRLDILDALTQSPHVMQRLGGSPAQMPPVKLLQELRRVIDPDQLNVHLWLDRIDFAERWFASEDRLAPGVPPKGPRAKTDLRVQQIEDLLISGLSVQNVASALNLSVSNVYQILHRHGLSSSVKAMRRTMNK